MMLAAILAIGVSALHLEEDRHKEAVRYDYFFLPLKRGGLLAVVLFTGIILWSGQWLVRHYVAEAYCNTVPNSTLNLDENPPLSSIRQAMWWDGGNAGYPFKAARNIMNERDKDPQKAGGTTPAWNASHEPIIAMLEQAIRRNPFNAEYHEHLGWEYSYMTRQNDYMARWMPAADLSMERADYVAGNWVMNPRIHVSLGHYWTMRSRMLSDDTLRQESLWNRAVWHYRKALELLGDKPLSDEIAKYIKAFYPDGEHLKEII
jgi:hypothetical protein